MRLALPLRLGLAVLLVAGCGRIHPDPINRAQLSLVSTHPLLSMAVPGGAPGKVFSSLGHESGPSSAPTHAIRVWTLPPGSSAELFVMLVRGARDAGLVPRSVQCGSIQSVHGYVVLGQFVGSAEVALDPRRRTVTVSISVGPGATARSIPAEPLLIGAACTPAVRTAISTDRGSPQR